ncbi:MAG: thioredoxin domain-containing protein [Bacteroidota bacterium]
MIRLFALVASLLIFAIACKSPNGPAQGHGAAGTNHLANESSPYLLQHANNPVDWYPWGEEALAKAKAENKLMIISVGYAACHWCHVMEHESFEDTTVSKLMNEHFVNIKVDREERPDIDDVYMTACHMASGRSCGWPLNAFALPDGRPVWAGTYFPKEEWMKVMDYFIKVYQDEPDKLETYASELTQGIQSSEEISINLGDQQFTKDVLNTIGERFLTNIDYERGGRQGAPKFPMPNNYQFLLSYYHQSENPKALEAITATLDNIANGGIYDHLGGGFARYSVDADWIVPHFEKMLYDNGQLVSLYAQAYRLNQNPLYQQVVEETLEFVERELMDKNGGFYSSLDADSEGEEGKFYVWIQEELATMLSGKDLAVFSDYYEIKEGGNWEEEKNILYRRKPIAEVAQTHGIDENQVKQIITKAKKQLFAARAKRVRPGLDDKILSSWNALMLQGYVDAYRSFGQEAYLQTAIKNAQFLEQNMMQKDHRLNRNFKDGQSSINAFLDDYALLINAFVSLYQVTFDESWLNKANDLAEYTLAHFFDEETGMFNYTSDLDPPLIARKKELADNVIPGSNSSMARALHRLGTFLYNSDYLAKSKQMMHNMSETLATSEAPNFYSNWCHLYKDLVYPPFEVAVVGDNYQPISQGLLKAFLPNALFLGGKNEGNLELLKDKLQEGETMIYVCQNKVCKMPVTEVDKAITLIK